MSVAIIIAIAISIATALGVALFAVRRAGQSVGPEANYGRELEAMPRGRRGMGPGARQRAMLAIVIAAIAAIGAGFATALSQGPH